MIVIISNPEEVKNENKIIRDMLNEGLDIFHIRRKEYTEISMRRFIESIPETFFSKLVLHSHYHLAAEYKLRGIHVPYTYTDNNSLQKSMSFHSTEEILVNNIDINYGFLSPIFDSISKQGYKQNFCLHTLQDFLKNRTEKILALGGVSNNNISCIKQTGFSGIALLGAVWLNKKPLAAFKEIQKTWIQANNTF